jgi:transposase
MASAGRRQGLGSCTPVEGQLRRKMLHFLSSKSLAAHRALTFLDMLIANVETPSKRWARPGAHAVLILDQAGWHTTDKLAIPSNITLLPLPPRSPELNPVENIWQFMRGNWLSNRVFKSHDDIIALCCEAWNKLIQQPWKIISIGRRQWAHGF